MRDELKPGQTVTVTIPNLVVSSRQSWKGETEFLNPSGDHTYVKDSTEATFEVTSDPTSAEFDEVLTVRYFHEDGEAAYIKVAPNTWVVIDHRHEGSDSRSVYRDNEIYTQYYKREEEL